MQFTNYTIERQIGEGGMAIVYLAKHNILQKPVAIKVLKQEFIRNDNIRKRFLSEARNMFEMSHPNIIKVTDLIDQDDTVAFVMEYVEGITLKEHIERKGSMNPADVKELFHQMLDAVGYVHEKGFVHRDVKPSNFMLDAKGKIKLLDFGIAKNTDTNAADYTMTGTLQSMGTPLYMSPEQVKSSKDVTLRSDIYSLGVVLWQMIRGQKPYDSNTLSIFEIQMKIVGERLAPTGTSFDPIISRATEKEPSNRYSSCQVFADALKNVGSMSAAVDQVEATIVQAASTPIPPVFEPVATPNPSPVFQPAPKQKSNPLNPISLIVGFLLVIILGVMINNKESSVYESDIVEDPVAVDTVAPAVIDTTAGSIAHFKNNTNTKIWIALAYDNAGFETNGWFSVDAFSEEDLSIPAGVTSGEIYWYGVEDNEGLAYEGQDRFFCVHPTDKFHYVLSDEVTGCSNPIGFTRMDISGGRGTKTFN